MARVNPLRTPLMPSAASFAGEIIFISDVVRKKGVHLANFDLSEAHGNTFFMDSFRLNFLSFKGRSRMMTVSPITSHSFSGRLRGSGSLRFLPFHNPSMKAVIVLDFSERMWLVKHI